MDADDINKAVRQALVQKGFVGIIPVSKAQLIVDEVVSHYHRSAHKVTVVLSPIHNIGKPMSCDCNRSTIRVEPRHPSASKVR